LLRGQMRGTDHVSYDYRAKFEHPKQDEEED
jgi:hypothetical protein